MSKDLNDTLRGFGPSDAGLNKGALLFEAGRASAPSAWRAWALVGLLSLTQAITLVALFLPTKQHPSPTPVPARIEEPSTPPESSPLRLRELPEWKPEEGLGPDRPPLRPIDVDFSVFD
jgi:hypothetical protein